MNRKLISIGAPYECRYRVCKEFCELKDIQCKDKWNFPNGCPLRDDEVT